MKNLNFYKLGFSIIYIIACLSISMSAYYKQNFKDYAKILISYSQFQFEAHSKVKKLFRDKDFITNGKIIMNGLLIFLIILRKVILI